MEATTFRHEKDNEVMTLCNSWEKEGTIRVSAFGGYTLQKNEIVALIALLAEQIREK